MDKKQAEELGWKFSGDDDNVTGEKGRLMHMGKLEHVLMLIAAVEKNMSKTV